MSALTSHEKKNSEAYVEFLALFVVVVGQTITLAALYELTAVIFDILAKFVVAPGGLYKVLLLFDFLFVFGSQSIMFFWILFYTARLSKLHRFGLLALALIVTYLVTVKYCSTTFCHIYFLVISFANAFLLSIVTSKITRQIPYVLVLKRTYLMYVPACCSLLWILCTQKVHIVHGFQVILYFAHLMTVKNIFFFLGLLAIPITSGLMFERSYDQDSRHYMVPVILQAPLIYVLLSISAVFCVLLASIEFFGLGRVQMLLLGLSYQLKFAEVHTLAATRVMDFPPISGQ